MNKFNKFIENKHNKSKLHFSPFQNYSNHFLCECGGFESNYVEDLKIFSYLVVCISCIFFGRLQIECSHRIAMAKIVVLIGLLKLLTHNSRVDQLWR